MSSLICLECGQAWGVLDKDFPLEPEPSTGVKQDVIVCRCKQGSNSCTVCDQTRRFNFDNEEMGVLKQLRDEHPPLGAKYDAKRLANVEHRAWHAAFDLFNSLVCASGFNVSGRRSMSIYTRFPRLSARKWSRIQKPSGSHHECC
jgi:hypothetical protein